MYNAAAKVNSGFVDKLVDLLSQWTKLVISDILSILEAKSVPNNLLEITRVLMAIDLFLSKNGGFSPSTFFYLW